MSDKLKADLTKKLQAAIEASKSAKQAIDEAARYWKDEYRVKQPNADHEMVPADWEKALVACINVLDGFRQITEAQIKELNKPFG